MIHKIRCVMGMHYDHVELDGKRLDPGPSQAVWNHSPDGFSWGYGGSGPAQLALALLLAVGIARDDAVRLHQDFTQTFVAAWPQDSGLHEVDIEGWAEIRLAELAGA